MKLDREEKRLEKKQKRKIEEIDDGRRKTDIERVYLHDGVGKKN
jgi:hypothetical protein